MLRDVTWPQSRRQFSAIGADDPAITQDARGLLLTFRQIGNKPWFIFIVGIVNKDVVQDIRIVALSATDKHRTWKTSDENPTALAGYRQHYQQFWKQRSGGATTQPRQYTTFPQEADVFTVQLQGQKNVVVKHVASGAQWELNLE